MDLNEDAKSLKFNADLALPDVKPQRLPHPLQQPSGSCLAIGWHRSSDQSPSSPQRKTKPRKPSASNQAARDAYVEIVNLVKAYPNPLGDAIKRRRRLQPQRSSRAR